MIGEIIEHLGARWQICKNRDWNKCLVVGGKCTAEISMDYEMTR